MKIQTLKRMIMLSGLAMLATVSAHAQGGKQVAVTIPFNFYAGDKTLPAGQYLVGRSTQTSGETLVLRATDGRSGVFVLTREIQNNGIQKQSKLVFHRYENQYFLSEFWISGRSNGRALPGSRKERLMKEESAKRGGNLEKVAVAADKP